MNCRRQALSLFLNALVIVVIQIGNEFLFEALHGLELLQIKQFTFQQAEEVFRHRIVQAVPFAAHACRMPFALSILWYCLCWYCQPWSEWRISLVPSGIVVKALASMVVTMFKTGRSEMV